jgi:hypothetical protein
MADQWTVFVEGLREADLSNAKDEIKLAAAQAINKMARDYRAKGARRVRDQVNFPAKAVANNDKGMHVSEKANRHSLQARITAYGRPRSLANYVVGSKKPYARGGVYLQVAPGKTRFMRRAFIMKLYGTGGSLDEGLANLGLAIRLRPGETLRNKTDAISYSKASKGLYLLYGPSVDQVFRSRDGTGVANDMVPEIEDDLSKEFVRLLKL